MDINNPSRFKEDDKKKLVDFLNFVAKKAKFSDLDIKEVIEFYGLLSFCQQTLMKKINDHIVEVVKIHEPIVPEPEKKARARAK